MTDLRLFQAGRRAFITNTLGGIAGSCALGAFVGCTAPAENAKHTEPDAWAEAEKIRQGVKAPQFPDRTFDVRDFGAKPNSQQDNSKAFAAAIEACNKAGGGKSIGDPR